MRAAPVLRVIAPSAALRRNLASRSFWVIGIGEEYCRPRLNLTNSRNSIRVRCVVITDGVVLVVDEILSVIPKLAHQ